MAKSKKQSDEDVDEVTLQPGWEASNRTKDGDIDQLDANGYGLPKYEPEPSKREGVSGTDVGRFGPRR